MVIDVIIFFGEELFSFSDSDWKYEKVNVGNIQALLLQYILAHRVALQMQVNNWMKSHHIFPSIDTLPSHSIYVLCEGWIWPTLKKPI